MFCYANLLDSKNNWSIDWFETEHHNALATRTRMHLGFQTSLSCFMWVEEGKDAIFGNSDQNILYTYYLLKHWPLPVLFKSDWHHIEVCLFFGSSDFSTFHFEIRAAKEIGLLLILHFWHIILPILGRQTKTNRQSIFILLLNKWCIKVTDCSF